MLVLTLLFGVPKFLSCVKRYDTINVFAIGEKDASVNLTPRFRNFERNS